MGGRSNNNPTAIAIAAAVPAIAAAAWAWAFKKSSAPPKLWVGDGPLKCCVLPWCTLLTRPYVPAPLALNRHAQNVLGFIRGCNIQAGYTRQLIIAQDGGTLGLDWFAACDAPRFGPPGAPVLLVLHGINGGSHEGYCKWICSEACKRGWRATVLNYRGCGGLPLTSPRGYAASLTHDIHFTITSIKGRFPHAPIFAVGFSLGGIFLTKYLAEADNGLHASAAAARQPATLCPAQPIAPAAARAAPPPVPPASSPSATADGASDLLDPQQQWRQGNASGMALGAGAGMDEGGEGLDGEAWCYRGSGLAASAVVSSPICLFNSMAQLSQPFTVNYLYNLALAYKLREFIREHEKEIRAGTRLNLEVLLSQWTVLAMEDNGIPQTLGFRNRLEYYEAVSSLGYIPHIKTPTLILVAEDDPFLGVLPDQECATNPNTLLVATARGGHVAFLQGLWPFGPAYMDQAVLQFLDAAWKHLPPPAPDRPLPATHGAATATLLSAARAPGDPPCPPPLSAQAAQAGAQGAGDDVGALGHVPSRAPQQEQGQQDQEEERGAQDQGLVGHVWLQPEVLSLGGLGDRAVATTAAGGGDDESGVLQEELDASAAWPDHPTQGTGGGRCEAGLPADVDIRAATHASVGGMAAAVGPALEHHGGGAVHDAAPGLSLHVARGPSHAVHAMPPLPQALLQPLKSRL